MEIDPRNANDRTVFRRVGIITVLWIILLVIAGLLLLYFGPSLSEIVFSSGLA